MTVVKTNPPDVKVRALAFRADGSTGFCVFGRPAEVGEVVSVDPGMADTLVRTGKAERA